MCILYLLNKYFRSEDIYLKYGNLLLVYNYSRSSLSNCADPFWYLSVFGSAALFNKKVLNELLWLSSPDTFKVIDEAWFSVINEAWFMVINKAWFSVIDEAWFRVINEAWFRVINKAWFSAIDEAWFSVIDDAWFSVIN